MPKSSESLANLITKRYDCVQSIVTDSRSKSELVRDMSIPRSTLDDIVRELEQEGLVEYRDGEWNPTLLGQLAAERYERYVEFLKSFLRADSVLAELPPDSTIDPCFLLNAEVYNNSSDIVDKQARILFESVKSAHRIWFCCPVVMGWHFETFYERATVGDDYKLEIIIPTSVSEELSCLFPEQITKARRDDRVTMYITKVPINYTLWIADDEAGIIVYADYGICGVILNDTEAASTWATNQYDRIRTEATLLETVYS